MVKTIIFTFSALMLGCSSSNNLSHSQESMNGESIVINHNGAYSGFISSDETVDSCKTFLLDNVDVTEFFSLAEIATEREYVHDLTASNCYSSGSFISTSGQRGEWKIDRSRRGMLTVGSQVKYYYCPKCNSSNFYEP